MALYLLDETHTLDDFACKGVHIQTASRMRATYQTRRACHLAKTFRQW